MTTECEAVMTQVLRADRGWLLHVTTGPLPPVPRLVAWESALRFRWNLALEQRKLGLACRRDERIFPTAFDQINQLTELRADPAVAGRRTA